MSLKDIVDRDCGGSNALMKLTSHFTEDRTRQQDGIGWPVFGPEVPFNGNHMGELVNEYLQQPAPVNLMPTTFDMQSILQEVQDIEKMYNTPVKDRPGELDLGPGLDRYVEEYSEFSEKYSEESEWVKELMGNAEDHWPAEYVGQNSVPRRAFVPSGWRWANEYVEQKPAFVPTESRWADEYLEQNLDPLDEFYPKEGQWAEEYLESADKEASQEKNELADKSSEADVVTAVDDLLKLVDSSDPKFKNSKFIQFLHGIRDGTVKLIEPTSTESDVILADKWINEFGDNQTPGLNKLGEQEPLSAVGDHWANEFVEEQETSRRVDDEDVWVHEFVKTNFSGPEELSWEQWSRDMNTANNVADKWADDFESVQSTEFWNNLQQQWDDLAKQNDPEVRNWMGQYDNFDNATYYKDYSFEQTNPLLDHPDAFQEGLERLKKGEISNAVLLFEAAVRKNPDHEEAWQYLGTTQASNEEDPKAIAALKKCLELNQTNLTAHMALAVSYANECMQQNSCTALHEWIRLNPKYSRLLTVTEATHTSTTLPRVTSFVSEDYYRQVEDMYLRAVQATPKDIDPDIQIGLGILLNLSGEYNKAVDCFQTALQIRPDDALIWNKLGATLSNGQRSEEAVEAFRRALNILPGYVRTRHNLGLACMNLGADREAMEHFLVAINLQKNDSGPKGARAITSDNMWLSVRTVITKMGRTDLYQACNNKDLDALNKEFPTNI